MTDKAKVKDEKKPIKEAELDKVNAGKGEHQTNPTPRGAIGFGPPPIKWV